MAQQPHYGSQAYRDCDVVRQDTIWRKAVHRETRSAKKWRENWSFISEYDSKGQKKKTPPKPSNRTYFSDKVPVTTSQDIGSRASTPLNQVIKQLERTMSKPNQKSDLNTALVYI
eukprot:m.4636 g.4636  ORF g.4636 m.4636 type:complete len:115 (+) comp11038_c0_seq1:104-448(+)